MMGRDLSPTSTAKSPSSINCEGTTEASIGVAVTFVLDSLLPAWNRGFEPSFDFLAIQFLASVHPMKTPVMPHSNGIFVAV
jgi:hypothetical protein